MVHEWKDCSLGDVVELKRGYDLPKKERSPGDVPLVSSSGVTDTHAKAMVKGPGVVTGRYGTLGQVFYVEQDFWPLNTTLYVRDFKGNAPRFISYFLRDIDFLAYSDKAAVPGLNRNHLHQARVRIPIDLTEQHSIAHILAALDDKIELNRRQNETLAAIARALFKAWFVDFDGAPQKDMQESELGSIPKDWRIVSLSDVLEIIGGGTPKTSVSRYWGGDIPWFSVVDTPAAGDVFVTATGKNITQAGLDGSSVRLIQKGTTIISARGTVGNLAIAGCDMTFNQSCYGLRGKNGAGDYFVFLTAQRMVDQLKSMAHGSVFSTITRQTFDSISIAAPPENVFRQFEQSVSTGFEKILSNVQQSRTLMEMRDTLLPKLISGELRVADVDAGHCIAPMDTPMEVQPSCSKNALD